jgi:hypothetical protein
MTVTPRALQPATAAERPLDWAQCALCWGQRRIWTRVPARNGEGTVLVPGRCTGCLGVGEVLR